MSERVIGLRIEINGFRGVVSNLEQLDKLIREAKEDLQQLEIGGELFVELANQIKFAETQFMKLQEVARGQSLEKSLEGYGKLAAGITSSFAAAQAAVSLFGNESEAVSKAATEAQNLLTLALSARSIAEIKTGANIVATTIATKAQTLATNTANTAMKAFYTTIAANPMTALIALLGVAVTAMIAFSDSTEDATESQKEFNETVNTEAGKTLGNLKLISASIMNNKLSIDERKKSIEQLRKIAGPYYKDLSDEQILTRDLTKDIEELTKAVIKQAEAEALRERIKTRTAEVLKLEDEIEDVQKLVDKYTELEKSTAGVVGGGSVPGLGGGQAAAIVNVNKLAGATAQLNELQSKRNALILKSENDVVRLQRAEGLYSKVLGDGTKELEKNNKEVEKRIRLSLKEIELAELRRKQIQESLDELGKEFKATSDAVIIPLQQKRIDELKKDYEQITQFILSENEKIQKSIIELFFGGVSQLTKQENAIIKAGDKYLQIFTELFKEVKTSAEGITSFLDGKLALSLEDIRKKIDEINADEILTNQQKTELVNYFNEIVDKTNEFDNAIKLIIKSQQEIGKEFAAPIPSITKVYDTLIGLSKQYEQELIDSGGNVTIAQENIIKIIESTLKELKLTQIDLSTIYGDTTDFTEEQAKEFEKVKKKVEDYNKSLLDLIEKLKSGTITIADFSILVGQTALEISKNKKELDSLNASIKETQKRFQEIILSGDLERFKQLLGDLGVTDIQFLNTIVNDLDRFKTSLGDEALTKAIEQSLKIGLENLKTASLADSIKYDEFVKQFKKKLEETQPELAKAFEDLFDKIDLTVTVKKTLDKVEFLLREFGRLIGGIASAVRDSYSFQLQLLENDYQKTLNTVVGDTEQANQKRIELEKQYQENKKRLEKEAQVRSLQFTLAQTIASGAQAVVSTLANPLLDPISKGIIIGIDSIITAAQVGLISQQLSFAQTLRRGGMLNKFGAGGITNGPSHENGGIRFQNGGFELEGNEAVINRMSTLNYSGLLSQINQSGGGRPILVSSAMDSRLIEVLAKERDTPIRAYVVEQDITNAQQINRKLEQLASF